MSDEKKALAPAAYHWRALDARHAALGINVPIEGGGQLHLMEIVLQRHIAENFAKWILASWPATDAEIAPVAAAPEAQAAEATSGAVMDAAAETQDAPEETSAP